jgi:hypothetical protein
LRAVVVGEWHSSGHALHVFRGVKLIAFDELDPHGTRERRADQALARGGYAHHQV